VGKAFSAVLALIEIVYGLRHARTRSGHGGHLIEYLGKEIQQAATMFRRAVSAGVTPVLLKLAVSNTKLQQPP
jgi:hypothetical protein